MEQCFYGNGFDGAIHLDLIRGFGGRGFGFGGLLDGIQSTTATITMVGQGYNRNYSYNAGRRGSINTNDNTNRNFSSRNNNYNNQINRVITVEI
jgi:hypothetical protein